MDLIDGHVSSVRVFLPRDLASQAADRETELGRPLTDAERADLLRQYGHPVVMAVLDIS